jgi:hypothetical protein
VLARQDTTMLKRTASFNKLEKSAGTREKTAGVPKRGNAVTFCAGCQVCVCVFVCLCYYVL